jgi:hypothetical protein
MRFEKLFWNRVHVMNDWFEKAPLVQQFLAENLHEVLEEILRARFRRVPREVRRDFCGILNTRILKKLCGVAASCADVAAFYDVLKRLLAGEGINRVLGTKAALRA